ncbi:MAG: riboflavin synthase, partial [Brevinema sp.]
MFTGIVEGLGVIKKLRKSQQSVEFTIECNLLDDTKCGDSIAVNGVCLTITKKDDFTFNADVMNETIQVTSLSTLLQGDIVNLERALRLSDRLGGHIVSGHIDAVGIIAGIQQNSIASVISVTASEDILRYIIKRGSITIDGISLTVIDIDNTGFKVSIIPHTMQQTNLSK